MTALDWIHHSDRMTGRAHPVLPDTLNAALRQLLTESGYDPDADPFPGLMGPVYNVKAFGAVGDGVTNDRTAVNAAITAANAAGGGVVWVPPGVYAVAGAILAKPNVLLQCSGRNVTTLRMTAAAQNSLLNCEANSPSNFVARDLTLDGNNLVVTAIIAGGLAAMRCSFIDVEMQNSLGHGASVIGTASRFTFVRCSATGTILGQGIRLRPDARQTTRHKVLFCDVGQTTSFGVGLSQCDYNLVQGCEIVGTAAGLTNEAINLTNAGHNRILGNECRSRNDGGIVLGTTAGQTCDHNVVEGNICEDNYGQGIFLLGAASYNALNDNKCKNNNRSGGGQAEISISISGGDVPTGNTVDGNNLFCDTAGRSTTGVAINTGAVDNEVGINTIGGSQMTTELLDTGTGTRYRGRIGGVSTPATLAAGSNNDYAPGKFETLRLTGDAGGTSVINGFTGGFNGRILRVINIGAVNIGIAHQAGGSTGVNRIITATAAQVNLPGVDDYADFLYDPVSARWRLINVTV